MERLRSLSCSLRHSDEAFYAKPGSHNPREGRDCSTSCNSGLGQHREIRRCLRRVEIVLNTKPPMRLGVTTGCTSLGFVRAVCHRGAAGINPLRRHRHAVLCVVGPVWATLTLETARTPYAFTPAGRSQFSTALPEASPICKPKPLPNLWCHAGVGGSWRGPWAQRFALGKGFK